MDDGEFARKIADSFARGLRDMTVRVEFPDAFNTLKAKMQSDLSTIRSAVDSTQPSVADAQRGRCGVTRVTWLTRLRCLLTGHLPRGTSDCQRCCKVR